MNTSLRFTLGWFVISTALTCSTQAFQRSEGRVDFGPFPPPAHGDQWVEVNLDRNLIALAARLTAKDEPEVTDLLKGVEFIQVNVIGLDAANRTEIESRIKTIRGQLESKGWQRIVSAQELNQDFGIYIKIRGQEAVAGLVVTVMESGKQAVLVNIVGDIRPEKLALLGDKLDLDPLRKLGHSAVKVSTQTRSNSVNQSVATTAGKP